MYTIIAQDAKRLAELQQVFAASDRARAKAIKAARKAADGARFAVIDAGYPAARWLVWDCVANDNLRGHARFPWFVSKGAAQKLADRRNREG